MTTTAPGPGPQRVKLSPVKPQGISRGAEALDDDPTVYPDYEQMGRDPVESDIAEALEPVVRRLMTERGIVCYVGSDSFIYWIKGNNKASVSPDVYILPGMSPKARPRGFAGSKDEGCWKTWIHGVAPSFALEVKAWHNPRKDELQSPDRHDALGTKELIVFDPFADRRRKPRKRFAVYRRNAAGHLEIVQETNDDRVRSEELDAFLVADRADDAVLVMLRLGLGPNGERILPFESELVDLEAQRADEEARLRQEEARMRQEEARMRQEEARRAEEATRVAREAARRMAELEAELARLRTGAGKRRKR